MLHAHALKLSTLLNNDMRRKRSGISTIVSATIMIAAVSILGPIMLIWANSNINAQARQLGNYYEQTGNALKENFIVENVWPSNNPSNYVGITIRNIGNIAINVTNVQILGLKSDGSTYSSASYSLSGTNGVMASKASSTVLISYSWNDPTNIKTLNISVTTARGSVQTILWKVAN